MNCERSARSFARVRALLFAPALVWGLAQARGAEGAPSEETAPPSIVVPTPQRSAPVYSPHDELQPSTPVPTLPPKAPVGRADWLSAPALDGARPMFLQSPFYDVTGPDFASADTVYKVAQAAQKLLGRYFTWPVSASPAMQVQLVSALRPDFSGPFTILADRYGRRTLLIRWDSSTQFSDVCLGLTSLSLEFLVAWRRGSDAATRVPDWLKLGFGKMVEAQLKPAVIEVLADQAHVYPGLSLSQVMTARATPQEAAPVLAVNSYWLLRYLTELLGEGDNTRRLFDGLLDGGNPVPALQAAFPDQFSSPKTLELWWRVGYGDVVERRRPAVESLARTRETLDRLQQTVVKRGDAQVRARLDDAWPERTQPEVRASLQGTLIIVDKWRPYANPVYNNAIFSLMGVFNSMLGKDEAAFREAWKKYQADRAQAEAIEAEVSAALK